MKLETKSKEDFYNNSERGNDAVCEIMEKLNKAAADEAIYERNKEVALSMIAEGDYTYEQISRISKLPFEEVKALAEGKTA